MQSNNVLDVRSLIGLRVLMRPGQYDRTIEEYKVLEVSPSGNFTRVMNVYGKKFWKPTTDLAVLEVLKSLEAHPEKVDR